MQIRVHSCDALTLSMRMHTQWQHLISLQTSTFLHNLRATNWAKWNEYIQIDTKVDIECRGQRQHMDMHVFRHVLVSKILVSLGSVLHKMNKCEDTDCCSWKHTKVFGRPHKSRVNSHTITAINSYFVLLPKGHRPGRKSFLVDTLLCYLLCLLAICHGWALIQFRLLLSASFL